MASLSAATTSGAGTSGTGGGGGGGITGNTSSSSASSDTGDTTTSSEGLCRPVRKNGKFNNPFPHWKLPSFGNVLRWKLFYRDQSNVPSRRVLDQTLPLVNIDTELLNTPCTSGVRVTWLGHACVLVQMDGINILTDPVFSQRCSPVQLFGPKRYRGPPCTIHDLPTIHAVVISHNHYDHLDYNTVRLLHARFGSELRWFVGSGLAGWFHDIGCENVVEMSWWEENCIPELADVRFVFVPAQHWSKRTAFDDNKSLWGGWCVLGSKTRFYFAGDTGYCPAFEQIGNKYGPFDLCAIPIGAYQPRWVMKCQHVDPAEAIQMHHDLKAKRSIGIHWGTFVLTDEFYLEPRERLAQLLREKGMSDDQFFTLDHGETKILDNHITVLE